MNQNHGADGGFIGMDIFRLAGVALLIGAALAGCERSSAPPPGQAVEVRLGYFANLTHAQAVLGVSQGEFAAAVAPAKLTTRVFNAGPSLIEALFAGEIDLGYIGPGPAINGYVKSQGQDLRVLAGAAANGVIIVARKDAGIETMADLKGKRIATPQHGNTQDISARHYLRFELKQDSLDNVLPVPNAEQASMMLRGQIDAAWSPEPWGARLIADAEGRLIAEEKDLWPEGRLIITLVVASPRFLREQPELARRMLAVHVAMTERLNRDPEQAAAQMDQALTSLTGKAMPPGVVRDAFRRVLFTTDPMPQSISTFAQWAYDLGFSKQLPDLTGLVDAHLLEQMSTGQAKD